VTLTHRTPIVGGNWKMNTTVGEAESLARELIDALGDTDPVQVIVCPPFTNLQAVDQLVRDTKLALGAQDVFWEESGAFTGEISAAMLAAVGVTWVICGHSERRRLLGETSEIVNRKVRRSLDAGLEVILAVGETEPERSLGQTEVVLEGQLLGSTHELTSDDLAHVVLAYEPVWAIGTGLTATPEQAQSVHGFIRGWLGEHFGVSVAGAMRIQYGGSVTAANAPELLSQSDIDGALVGGASLKPGEFASIVRAASDSLA
jgi:triosephosphate isomerase